MTMNLYMASIAMVLYVLIVPKEAECLSNKSVLLVTDSRLSGIYGVAENETELYYIKIQNIANPIAIKYNYNDENVYWTDVARKEVRRTSVDGKTDTVLYELGTDSIPDGIAVDCSSDLLFYSDAGKGQIAVMDLNGNNHAVVISTDIISPRSIVLDNVQGHIYWTDWGSKPKIETSDYDGMNRRVIIGTGLLLPNGLAIDFQEKWIFWADAGTHFIEKSRLDGTHRTKIYFEEKAHFFSLLFLEDNLYYTDWTKNSIMVLPVKGTEPSAYGRSTFSRPNDITLYGPMNTDKNGCSKKGVKCSHICIPKPGYKYACMCPDGMYLQDRVNCIQRIDKTPGTSRKFCKALVTGAHMLVYPPECAFHDVAVGKRCVVSCETQFIYSSGQRDIIIECQYPGLWSEKLGTCVEVEMTEKVNCPENIHVTVPKGKVTARVCWPEIKATGKDGIKPTIFESIRNGSALSAGEHTVNIFVIYNAGYFVGCQFNIFVDIIRCGNVPIPKYAYLTSGRCEDFLGSVCTFSCITGYQFENQTDSVDAECGMDRNGVVVWKTGHILCKPVVCPLNQYSDVQISGCSQPIVYGNVCEMECTEGYERVKGSRISICRHDGKMSGEELICREKPKLCKPLHQGQGVQVTGCSQPFVVGTVCDQSCIPSFEKVLGSDIRFCRSDGIWTGKDIVCRHVLVQHDSFLTWDRIIPYGILLAITLIWLSCNIARYNQNRLGEQRVDH